MQDHLLEGLQSERSLNPAAADRITEGLEVFVANEVPHWNPAGVGHGVAVVVTRGRIAAGGGKQASVSQLDAIAVEGLNRRGQRKHDHCNDQAKDYLAHLNSLSEPKWQPAHDSPLLELTATAIVCDASPIGARPPAPSASVRPAD